MSEVTSTQVVSRPTVVHWTALVLLVISVGINYIDRGNLSVAATSIERDLSVNQWQLGLLSSGFFWTYALCQIVAGPLIDRFNVNWIYAAGYLIWSVATAATGWSNGFWMIFGFRLLIGIAESIAYPSYSKIISATFPETLRGTANSMIDAGSKLGPAFGVLFGVKLVNLLTWRGMFVAIGLVSLVWLIPWTAITPRLHVGKLEKSDVQPPSYLELATKRPFWGTVLGLFGANYTWYFILTWLPYYFEHVRNYTHDRLAWLASIPLFLIAASSMLSGLLADILIRRGGRPTLVRRRFITSGLSGCCVLMFAAIEVSNEQLSVGLLSAACCLLGLFSSNHWALTQTLSGTRAAGKWTGAENCFGNLAGGVGAAITGAVLHKGYSFFTAFAIVCGFLVVAIIGFWFVIGDAPPVRWGSDESLTVTVQ
jgi:MFS transporter, ACS family, D-galactonate transporter